MFVNVKHGDKPMNHHRFALLAVPLVFAASSAVAQTHSYEFTDGLNDSVAGGTALQPSISPGNPTATSTVSGGHYNFDAGAGLFLGNQLPGAVYTIDMSVALTSINGYRKLISFQNIGTDLGLYNLSGALSLFNVANSATNTDFAAGQFTDVRISRDSSGLVTGYINGTLKLSYDDSRTNYYTTGTGGSGLWFLRDDTAQNGEQSAGSADYIRIYDTATIPPTVPGAVPETATWAMMIVGFGMAGGGMRRRRVAFATA